MLNPFRIITDGQDFKVQKRTLWFFWMTVQRPEDLDNKDFGGDKTFTTKKDAEVYINQHTPKKWQVVKWTSPTS